LQQTLFESNEFSSHLVTSAPTIICGITPEGLTLSVNGAITTVTGYTPGEVIGKNWWDLFYPGNERRQVDKLLEDFEKGSGSVTNYDMVLTTKDGSRRTVSWNSVNRFDAEGNLLQIIGIGADITDRRLAEEKLRSEQQLLRRLLNTQERDRQTVSHEIHDGFLQYVITAKMTLEALAYQMAKSGHDVPEGCDQVKELLGKAIGEGRRMIGDLRPMIIDEKGIVEAIHYLVAEETGDERIDITFHHEVQFDRLDPMLEAATFRIAQEALTNVRRHGKSPQAEIRLTQADGHMLLEISDVGIGFDVNQVPSHHFGLRGIVERARLFGGTATIDSTPGKGTRITARLPIVIRPE